jgi:hypothetical protein
MPLQARSLPLQGWGLIDLPLRASNEGLPRPRVARAQKIIRLHPLLCSASKKGTWPLPLCPSLRTSNNIYAPSKLTCTPSHGRALMLVYVRPSNEALLRARVPGAQDQRGCPSSFSSCALREHRRPIGTHISPLLKSPPSPFRGVAEVAVHCAHRTSTFLSCAFCEQEGHPATPLPFFL